MLVCVCHSISDKMLRNLILEKNIMNIREIRRCTSLGSQCGKCIQLTKELLDKSLAERFSDAS